MPIPQIITTYVYTWTETTPNYAGSTYRINAAQPIKIQTANKTDSTINITSGGNVNVESDLDAGANGTINLTSKLDEIITSEGSKITLSKVSLNAAENIDVTLGLPENKTTELKVTGLLETSRIFNVKINANTPLKNLDISGNKNVNIVGIDDISGKINARNLEITTPGNIDLTTQISDTFTAQGDKSVKVTQTSGDIKISKIASKGNVNLTAQNGAIVNSVDSAVNMTGAADKISAWQAAGMISDKDSDNSATNSAQAEKAIRLEALENLFKRWALKDDGTIDETIYNQFINNTADRTKLNDEQIIQMEIYQSLQKSTDYGFSKNQLLYAVQESLLNPSAGITASISDPIITGKNITLNANALDDITINADTTLPIKNVTSNDYTIIKANGNNVASDKNSVIRSTDVELTATNNIGTQSLPLTIFSEVMLLNAKHVYVYDGDPSGGEEGEHSGNDSSGGNSSKGGSSKGNSSGGGSSNNYSGNYSSGYSNFASNPSSLASNRNFSAPLGTTYTNNSLTYWQSTTSTAAPDYSFREFNNTANDMSYRQTRNYFEVKFIPTWLEREYMRIDFDYSFDNFGIKNATADELTID